MLDESGRVRPPIAFALVLIICAMSVGAAAAAANDGWVVDAAERQDDEAVRALIADGADVNEPQPDGATALQWAAHWDDMETVERLLEAGADVNAANALGVTALMLACENGSAPLVARLLEADADPNVILPSGESVLMRAARSGSADAVTALLEAGADVNAYETTGGQTALMWAASHGHAGAARALIVGTAEVHARSFARRRTIHIGSRFGDRSSYIGVIDTDKGGYTALMFAARSGHVDVARTLLKLGANVDDVSADGTSALVLSAMSGHGDFARVLVENGADVNARGSGYTALHAAVLRGDATLIEALADAGADMDARLIRGSQSRYWGKDWAFNDTQLVGATPLWLAARYGDVPLMHALVRAGADPHVSFDAPPRYFRDIGTDGRRAAEQLDPDGTTVLMAAIKGHDRPTMGDRRDRFLSASEIAGKPEDEDEQVTRATVMTALELGVDVNAADGDGNTALHHAATRQLDSVIQVLAEAGADVNAANGDGQTPLAALIAPGGRQRYPEFEGDGDAPSPTADLLRALGATEPSVAPEDEGVPQ